MKFLIVFYYFDGKTYEIEVHQDDMEKLMASLGKSEVYFNNSRGVGVWIPIEKVRYFEVEKVDARGRRVMECNSKISEYNVQAGVGETGDNPKGIESLGRTLQSPVGQAN